MDSLHPLPWASTLWQQAWMHCCGPPQVPHPLATEVCLQPDSIFSSGAERPSDNVELSGSVSVISRAPLTKSQWRPLSACHVPGPVPSVFHESSHWICTTILECCATTVSILNRSEIAHPMPEGSVKSPDGSGEGVLLPVPLSWWRQVLLPD